MYALLEVYLADAPVKEMIIDELHGQVNSIRLQEK